MQLDGFMAPLTIYNLYIIEFKVSSDHLSIASIACYASMTMYILYYVVHAIHTYGKAHINCFSS